MAPRKARAELDPIARSLGEATGRLRRALEPTPGRHFRPSVVRNADEAGDKLVSFLLEERGLFPLPEEFDAGHAAKVLAVIDAVARLLPPESEVASLARDLRVKWGMTGHRVPLEVVR